MPLPDLPSSRNHERGQLFAGWVVGIFVIAAMVVYVADTMRRERLASHNTLYRELALNIAKSGFEDGMSFFRTHSEGSYLLSSPYCPSSQVWTTQYLQYPDAAFLPGPKDTDFYSSITVSTPLSTTGQCAGAIIRDFTMNEFAGDVPNQITGSTSSVEMHSSSLWGRYVIRRQNVANWSPGPNTAAANTDQDACHDLSAIAAQSPLGSGTRWSITSRGYLVRLTTTANSPFTTLLSSPAAFNGNCLLSAPVSYYNNQPFLLAQARVYGEISRVNFNLPATAVYLTNGNGLKVNTNGILNGQSSYAYVCSDSTSPTNNGTITGSGFTNQSAPTVGNVFPGQTMSSLRSMAQGLETGNSNITGYVGGIEQLPVFQNSTFTTQVDQPSFYYLTTTVTLAANAGAVPVLNGVGLCIVNGNLTIPAGNNSSWAGVLYVAGNVTLDGPTAVNGILIATGTISIGNSADLNKTTVGYSSTLVTQVQNLLQNFTVDNSSIVATQF